MNKTPKKFYDKDSDSLWFLLKPGVEIRCEEIAPGVNLEFGENNELIGIEVLDYLKRGGVRVFFNTNSPITQEERVWVDKHDAETYAQYQICSSKGI